MWGIFILQTMNYLLSNSKLEEGKKKKKRGILSFLTKRLTHLGIVTNIFLSPFLFTEVLLQASQYTHKLTHSTSKYHLPSISYTHTTPFIPLSLSIFLFQLNLYPVLAKFYLYLNPINFKHFINSIYNHKQPFIIFN